jgi:hypothetical protein
MGLLCGGVAEAGPGRGPAHSAPACSVAALSRTKVVTAEGVELLIQPDEVSPSGAEVLVAGSPNYAGRVVDGRRVRVPWDSVLGVVMGADGVARPIPSPVPSRLIADVRALARPAGGWDVVIVERAPLEGDQLPPPGPVVRLWHGVHEGGRWTSLTEVPVPTSVELVTHHTTRLVRGGDTLSFALPSLGAYPRVAVLFQLHGGAWTTRQVPIGFAAYIALAHHPGLGLGLAVVRAPYQRGTGGTMSLYLHRPDRPDAEPWLLDAGERNVHHPEIVAGEHGFLVSWYVEGTEGTHRARGAEVAPGAVRVFPVDSGYGASRPIPIHGGDAGPWWVLAQGGRDRELRIGVLRGGGPVPREVAAVPNPFLRGLAAIRLSGEGELLASGPVMHDGVMISELVRIRLRCEEPGQRDTSPAVGSRSESEARGERGSPGWPSQEPPPRAAGTRPPAALAFPSGASQIVSS